MGIDYAGPDGIALPSVVNGTVILSGFVSNGYGVQVNIDVGNGCYIKYGHMSQAVVQTGDRVSVGDTVGFEDSTGASTGSHLHLGIWCNGVPEDPTPYVEGAMAGTAPMPGPSLPSAPPPDNTEAHWAGVLPESYAAFDSLRINVGAILPGIYAQIIAVRGGNTDAVSGGGGRLQ